MIDFFIEYRVYIFIALGIIEIFFSVIAFIIGCLKKNVSVESFILESLPSLIKTAEVVSDDGKQKKSFVISNMCTLIKQHFPKVVTVLYKSFISKHIEKILETPEKK